jgi:hypothetical protein
VEIKRCDFCGISQSGAWALIASPDISICDACTETMQRTVEAEEELGSGASGPPEGFFDRCSFCGGSQGPVVVGAEFSDDGADPVMCHSCIGVAVKVVTQQGIDFNDTWYAPFRKEGFGWIRNPGSTPPTDSRALLAVVRGQRAQMLAEWQADTAAGLASGGGEALMPELLKNAWRRIVGIYIAEAAQAQGQPLAYETAREVAEVLMGDGPV